MKVKLTHLTNIPGTIDKIDKKKHLIYEFSSAIDDGEGNLLVPIKDMCGDDILVDYYRMRNASKE